MKPSSDVASVAPKLTERQSPPRPNLAFRVGITGHRLHRLKEMKEAVLQSKIADILKQVGQSLSAFGAANPDLFSAEKLRLTALSPLAEGSDRIFAKEALKQQWDLTCVMPFMQEEYEKDFDAPSLAEFRSMLGKASVKFELDGDRLHADVAYADCGEVVLNESDLLIAIWDGTDSGKFGGTETMLDIARKKRIPTIVIDAFAPHNYRWLRQALPATEESIDKFVAELLKLPEPDSADVEDKKTGHKGEDRITDLCDYYSERPAKWNFAVLWTIFNKTVGEMEWPKLKVRLDGHEAEVLQHWPQEDWVADALRPYYAWTDKLSGRYGDRYRSAFLAGFMLAPIAVAAALAPIALQLHHRGQILSAIIELVIISAIMLMVGIGRHMKWHERWVDYRLAAEQIRHLRIVTGVGGHRLFPRIAVHNQVYGDPQTAWMTWYVNATARSIGLPPSRLEHKELVRIVGELRALIKEQIRFHTQSSMRAHNVEHRLHLGVLILLGSTLACCGLHLFHSPIPSGWLTFACGFFPAVGAGLAGIANQGEFRRVSKRSKSMAKHLEKTLERLDSLEEEMVESPNASWSRKVRAFAEETSTFMVHEVLDWRVVFLDRPLEFES